MALFYTLLVLLISPAQLSASCAEAVSPCSAFALAEVVALVRLDSTRHPSRNTTEAQGIVLKSYKGSMPAGTTIPFYGGGICYDVPTQVGAIYVVYAKRRSDGHVSTDCTRTRPQSEASHDIEFLDRFSATPLLAALIEPLGCNEHRLPPWLHRLWSIAMNVTSPYQSR